MSLRAELARLATRAFIKSRLGPRVSIAERRRQVAAFEQHALKPPASTRTEQVMLGGVPAARITTPASQPGRWVFFLHGGGYIAGSPKLYQHITWRVCNAARATVVALDYRLAPDYPYPAALQDTVAAWLGLLDKGAAPHRTAFLGDSAGGGLALAAALRLRDASIPLPATIVALSPWTDLAITGASVRRNNDADPMNNASDLPFIANAVLGGADPRDPYISPLYGDPSGLPPVLIQVGSDEILRDDSVRMAERMRQAGCDVTLEIWPRMPHVWHGFAPFVPESNRAIARIGAFMRERTEPDRGA